MFTRFGSQCLFSKLKNHPREVMIVVASIFFFESVIRPNVLVS
jgi:hypothetical protein